MRPSDCLGNWILRCAIRIVRHAEFPHHWLPFVSCRKLGKALTNCRGTHGSWRPVQSKKIPIFFSKPNCRKLQNDFKYVSLKIRSKGPQKLGPLFSLFFMRKTLSSGWKWFLSPYFPLIRGMFLLRSGLWFSFRALEVPKPRVKKRPY